MSFSSILSTAIEDLGKNGKIFSNERQFQFDLAQILKDKGYDVEFEVLVTPFSQISDYLKTPTKQREKAYIDLLIKSKDSPDEYFAIELKYKTPQTLKVYEDEDAITFPQGAPDLGSYLFWMDVHRLERVLCGELKVLSSSTKTKKIKEAYAVLLPNAKRYLVPHPASLYREFFPIQGPKAKTLCGYILIDAATRERVSGKQKGRSSLEKRIENLQEAIDYKRVDGKDKPVYPIVLNNAYLCKWNRYPAHDDFNYLIIDIQ